MTPVQLNFNKENQLTGEFGSIGWKLRHFPSETSNQSVDYNYVQLQNKQTLRVDLTDDVWQKRTGKLTQNVIYLFKEPFNGCYQSEVGPNAFGI